MSSEEEKEEEEEEGKSKFTFTQLKSKDKSRENRIDESVDTERLSVSDKHDDCGSEAQQLPEALERMVKMRPATQACKKLLQACKETTKACKETH